VTISTSADPVGAPVFYRNVPLMVSPTGEKGTIAPLPASAIPLIKWPIRNIGESESRTVMSGLPTCANCHSFSRDGKTLGLDLDGPRNDKGLYALVPVSKEITIRNQDSWHTFSPNGRWLAFSSKARGPYTQLMLTHIDGNGNDTPAIMVDNTTAANRAVNIPEFVNVAQGGWKRSIRK
jgi:hypothetical protein